MSLNGYLGLMEDWLNILVLIHVISAIVGIGPVFFGHVLLRKGQNFGQLRNSLALSKLLEKFPKTLGTLAVLSGLLLAWLGDYGFKELWIYGSIVLYILIQIVVIGFMAPAAQKLATRVFSGSEPSDQALPAELASNVARIDRINWIATILGLLLFLFMFFKPML